MRTKFLTMEKLILHGALDNAACRKFYTVKYIRMPELLDELNDVKGCGNLKKTIKAFHACIMV